jgi:hypothetical protein
MGKNYLPTRQSLRRLCAPRGVWPFASPPPAVGPNQLDQQRDQERKNDVHGVSLEPQLPGAVLPEQAPVPDVSPHHFARSDGQSDS